jgi:hypothetical protein
MWTCVRPAISRNGVALLAVEIEGSYGTHDNEKARISKYWFGPCKGIIRWRVKATTKAPFGVQLASYMGRSHTSSHLTSLPQVLSAGL